MLTVALDRIGRQRDYWQVPGKLPAALHLADASRGFEAIHLRHLTVHQHQVEPLALDGRAPEAHSRPRGTPHRSAAAPLGRTCG